MSRPFSLKKRGRIWYVRFAGEENYHTTGFTDRDRAEDYAFRGLHNRAVEQVIVQACSHTLSVYAHDFFIWNKCKWVARQRAKNRSLTKAVTDNRRGQLRNHLFPKFGNRKLSEITAIEIEDWLVSLPLAGQTKDHILYSLSIILREAKRDGIIDRNPAEDIEPMGKDSVPTSALTDDELAALFPANAAAFDKVWPEFQYGTMFALMVSSGMRPGEARALEWPSVIFDIPAVLIVQAVDASDELGPTKGKWKRGAIIPERTAELLRRWRVLCGQDSGFVFRRIHGKFHDRKTVYNKFVKGLARAGIKRAERHITMRSLRTTYNTRMRQMLLAHAMSEDVLRFFIGHRSVQMTDRYDNPELAAKLRALQPLGEQVNGFWG